jgi:AAA domain-containing protein
MVTAHHTGLGATVVEEFEALEAAVSAFLDLYEKPDPLALDTDTLERFGPYLEPIETLNSARIIADYGQELAAARQVVEEHWEKWQAEPRLSRFVAAVERRWLRSYPASELMHRTFPARCWIVSGLISEGLVLIAGKSGIGKSYWALQLGIAIAQGGKAFGCFDVEQGDVLYLSLEDDAQAMQERLAHCLEEGESYPERLTIAHEAPLLSEGLFERLESWLKSHPQARLILIDVLANIRPPRRSHGDIYQQDYAVGEALKPLARRYHVAIVLFHHCNKLVKPEDPLDAISGSTGLVAPADIKGVFTRARGEADTKLFLTGRLVQEQWAAFRFEEGMWTYLGEAIDVERSEARQAIIELLQQASGAMHWKAIAEQLRKHPSTTRFLLSKMVQRGEVKRAQAGWYALPSPPPSDPSSTAANAANNTNITNTANSANKTGSVGREAKLVGAGANHVTPEETEKNPPPVGAVCAVCPDEDAAGASVDAPPGRVLSLSPAVIAQLKQEFARLKAKARQTRDASGPSPSSENEARGKPGVKHARGWTWPVPDAGR